MASLKWIEAALLGVFDIHSGPSIMWICPGSLAEADIRRHFDAFKAFLIPDAALTRRFVKLELDEHLRVLSHALERASPAYERNRFAFNVAFIVKESTYACSQKLFQWSLRKAAKFFLKVEREDCSVSKAQPHTRELLYKMFNSLNATSRAILSYGDNLAYLTLISPMPYEQDDSLVICKATLASYTPDIAIDPLEACAVEVLKPSQTVSEIEQGFKDALVRRLSVNEFCCRCCGIGESRFKQTIAIILSKFIRRRFIHVVPQFSLQKRYSFSPSFQQELDASFTARFEDFLATLCVPPQLHSSAHPWKPALQLVYAVHRPEVPLGVNIRSAIAQLEEQGRRQHDELVACFYQFCRLEGQLLPVDEYLYAMSFEEASIRKQFKFTDGHKFFTSCEKLLLLLSHLREGLVLASEFRQKFSLSALQIQVLEQNFDVKRVSFTS